MKFGSPTGKHKSCPAFLPTCVPTCQFLLSCLPKHRYLAGNGEDEDDDKDNIDGPEHEDSGDDNEDINDKS